MLIVCAVAVGACGLGELDGLTGGKVSHDGGTGGGPIEAGGPDDEPLADASGAGGSVGDDVAVAGGSAGEGGSSGASGAGGTGEPDGAMDAGDAPGSDGASDAVADAGKILALTVYDTGVNLQGQPNAPFWAIMTNFQLAVSSDAVDIWPDYVDCYAVSIDQGGPPLVGKDWIRTESQSKLYNPVAPPFAEAKITVNGTANVYLIVDDRATPYVHPNTLGWTDTGYNMHIWENAGHPDRPFSIWVKMNQTGDVEFPIQNYNGAFNYFVIVD